MDKMKFETPNLTAENLKKLSELFPGVVTEGKVNVDLLRSYVGEEIFMDEAYEFTWVGKRAAIAEAGRPIRKTLRPCLEESRDWDTTENLYIEGDNLDVLKLLQESYLGKVKMIYIDPPYNTGSDKFVYRDKFEISDDEYNEVAEVYDDEGNKLYKVNKIANPRFHSRWCSEMITSLLLARNLLAKEGVLLVSIDDREVHNMRKICDEVFGAKAFVAQLVWEKKKKGSFLSNQITNIKEYILVYCKDPIDFIGLIGEVNSDTETYPCINASNKREIRTIPAGIESKYKEKNYTLRAGSEISDTTMSIFLHSDLVIENGVLAQELVLEGNWRYSQEAMTEFAMKKELYITRDLYLRRIVNDAREKTLKDLLPRVGDNINGQYNDPVNTANLFDSGWGSNEDADEELRLLFGVQKLLDYPKPMKLLYKLIASYRQDDFIVLDFFSGSATTAHAVMKLNADVGGKRKFIMVQLPEDCAVGTEAAKAGYKNICEIGKERIRRAGDKIKAEAGLTAQNLDIGFRVLKLDDTNMNEVYYAAGDYNQDMLSMMESNIKPDRNDMDLLFGCLLDWGLPLSMPHTHEKIDGFTVHTYNGGDLIACFEERISEKAIREIANRKPLRAVFRDSSFISSPEKINVFEIFKLLAPNTSVKVI